MCFEPSNDQTVSGCLSTFTFLKFFFNFFPHISSMGMMFKNNISKVYITPQISKIYLFFMSVSLDLGAGKRLGTQTLK